MSVAGVVRAVRRFCLACQGGSPASVSSCLDVGCLFYPVRGARAEPEDKEGSFAAKEAAGTCPETGNSVEPAPGAMNGPSPLRLVRGYCLGCAGSRLEVRECGARDGCPLWSYRFGVRPSTFRRVSSRLRKERQSLKLPGL